MGELCKSLPRALSFRVVFRIVFLCKFISEAKNLGHIADSMAPVILVPGISQSQIEGKWDSRFPPPLCPKKEENWEIFWLNLSIPQSEISQECWVYRFRLRYQTHLKEYYDQEGVTTRIPGEFGSLAPSEFLSRDAQTRQETAYFHSLIEAFEKVGYKRGVTIFGASYDWRYAPQELERLGYNRDLCALVEKTVERTKRRVAIVAHSMGGLVATYFLQKQPKAWKKRYINSFTAVSTPWLGSVYGLGFFLVGTNYYNDTIKGDTREMRELYRTFQSSALLLPDERTYHDTVLVEWVTELKNYTARDYRYLFRTVGYETGYYMREDLISFFPPALDKLEVPTTCLYSTVPGKTTLAKYIVDGSLIDPAAYEEQYGVGDTLVPIDSLQYCEKFKNVKAQGFQKLEHFETITNQNSINHIIRSCASTAPLY